MGGQLGGGADEASIFWCHYCGGEVKRLTHMLEGMRLMDAPDVAGMNGASLLKGERWG